MIVVNGYEIKPTKFPGGELHVSLPDVLRDGRVQYSIFAQIESSDDLMCLLLVTDALRRYDPSVVVKLIMPYIPYARQDRVANPGEALSIKVFANLINAQNYATVRVADPHSDVATALIDRVIVEEDSQSIVSKIFNRKKVIYSNCILIAPDAGAMKKVKKIADRWNIPAVYATKSRDTKTGKLSNPKIDFGDIDITDKDLLVVDDICDGGYTFIMLAEAIEGDPKNWKDPETKKYHSLNLCVTHGIFSKGVGPLLEKYDRVLCAFPFSTVDKPDSLEIV